MAMTFEIALLDMVRGNLQVQELHQQAVLVAKIHFSCSMTHDLIDSQLFYVGFPPCNVYPAMTPTF